MALTPLVISGTATKIAKPAVSSNEKKGLSDETMQAMERCYRERASLRGTGRIFGISNGAVFNKIKKSP